MFVFNSSTFLIIAISQIDPRETRGCLDHSQLGPGSGCCNSSLAADCRIQSFNGFNSTSCYCDEECYHYNNCCDDILDIGCFGKLPRECLSLNMYAKLHVLSPFALDLIDHNDVRML